MQHQQKVSCNGVANSALGRAKDRRILGNSPAKQHHLLKTYRLKAGKTTLASAVACHQARSKPQLQWKEAAATASALGPVLLVEYFIQDLWLLSHVPGIKTLTVPNIQTPAFALLLPGRMLGCQGEQGQPRGCCLRQVLPSLGQTCILGGFAVTQGHWQPGPGCGPSSFPPPNHF